jgi:hypothetical protein
VAASASDGPLPSPPPLTIWRGCRSSWRPPREGSGHCRLIGRWRIVEADIWDRACEGTAELLDDGTLEIEIEYRNGDEAVLKANGTLLQQPASGSNSGVLHLYKSVTCVTARLPKL